MKFRFVDMFSGIGGFHTALKQLGGECVAACEIDDAARKTYLANHDVPDKFFYRDITTLAPHSVPDHDFLCAGFPCQPFSICGKQGAFSDQRSNVVHSLIEVIKVKKPKMVLLENVKHIRHVEGGKVFSYITESLSKLGYSVDTHLLNASDYGIPQNRERWFFIGILGEEQPVFTPVRRKKIALESILDTDGDFEFLKQPYTLLRSVRKQPSGLIFCGYRDMPIRKKGVRADTKHLSRVHKQPNRIYSSEGVHPTIPSQETSGRFWVKLGDDSVRKLTLTECFRLMGFEDSFVKPVPESELYRQVGNSVCVPVVKALATSLLKQTGYGHYPEDDTNESTEYIQMRKLPLVPQELLEVSG